MPARRSGSYSRWDCPTLQNGLSITSPGARRTSIHVPILPKLFVDIQTYKCEVPFFGHAEFVLRGVGVQEVTDPHRLRGAVFQSTIALDKDPFQSISWKENRRAGRLHLDVDVFRAPPLNGVIQHRPARLHRMRAVLNRVLRVCKLRGLKTEWQLFVRVVAHRRVEEVGVVASLLQGPAEVREEVLFERMLGYDDGTEDGEQTESGLLIIIDSRLR